MEALNDLPGAAGAGRDPRLECFASGGVLDDAMPSAHILGVLEDLALPSGPDGVPFAGATHDEAAGMLAAAVAAESHAAALKLALVREIIRRHAPDAPASPGAPRGAFPSPSTWRLDTAHEIAAILRVSVQSAGPLADLAWQLEARLPGTGGLLDAGVLSFVAARIVAEEFSVLDDVKVAEAEKRLLDHDLAADGMTPGAIRRLCQRIADTVDPHGAAERREAKQADEARVRYFRDHGGAASLLATGLPPDAALMSEANVQKRALEYRKAGIREKMDRLRLLALVDFTNGVDIPARLVLWRAEQAEKERVGADDPGRREWEREQAENEARARYGDRPPFPDEPPFPDAEPPDLDDRPAGDGDCQADPFQDVPPFPEGPSNLDDQDLPGGDDAAGGDDPWGGRDGNGRGDAGGRDDSENDPEDGPGDGPGGEGSPGDGGGPDGGTRPGGGPGTGPAPAGMPDPGLPATVNLTLPLATVLGQADRPGEAPGYGSVDPALVRDLADAAAQSPRSRFCVTLTDEEGHAAAHGCARLIRGTGQAGEKSGGVRDGPPGTGWDFSTDTTRPGPDGGYGAWILTLPSGARYRVAMHAIPLRDCDHRYATGAYRPSALLRHLVEIRDGECTFVSCSHPARKSDFEHTTPYDKGGVTDACNGGIRSRRCHRVKQLPGWTVTQPQPGWHRWEAPSGRSYTKSPKSYPA